MRRLLALCLALVPAIAFAAEPTPEAVARAEALANEALERYQAGDHAKAAQAFFGAYELTGRHTQLKNAAKSFEQAGMLEDAVALWERYANHPEVDPAKRKQARQRAVELRGQIKTTLTPLPEDEDERPPAPAPRIDEPDLLGIEVAPRAVQPYSRPLAWGLVGGGGAAVAAGATFFFSGWIPYWNFPETPVTHDEADAARTRAGVGVALMAVGAAVLTGALLFAFDDS